MDKQKIYIIDYKAGNLYSLQRALLILGYKSEIITDPELVLRADKLILPGVGSFHQGINNLKKNNLDNAIFDYYKSGNYLLGICLGMQLFMNSSSEFGDNEGLSLIKGSVNKLQPYKKYPIPHVGWNEVYLYKNKTSLENKVFTNTLEGKNFYFVHSFACTTKNPNFTIAACDYLGVPIPAIVSKGIFMVVNFIQKKVLKTDYL